MIEEEPAYSLAMDRGPLNDWYPLNMASQFSFGVVLEHQCNEVGSPAESCACERIVAICNVIKIRGACQDVCASLSEKLHTLNLTAPSGHEESCAPVVSYVDRDSFVQ